MNSMMPRFVLDESISTVVTNQVGKLYKHLWTDSHDEDIARRKPRGFMCKDLETSGE